MKFIWVSHCRGFMNCYLLSFWCFIVLFNHDYHNFCLFLTGYAWWQILYPMVALPEVDYFISQYVKDSIGGGGGEEEEEEVVVVVVFNIWHPG